MLTLKKLNPQVLEVTRPIVPLSRQENEFLKDTLRQEHLDRLRICCHRAATDRLHEMLMVFSGDTYIRPSLHIDKEESLLVLEGFGTYVFFDDKGIISDRVPLGPIGSGRSFYCRIGQPVPQPVDGIRPASGQGNHFWPFRREDTVFAPWSPDGSNPEAVRSYLDSLRTTLGISR